eukprot:4987679-Heterocapsa_arctica.AAC.1
MPGVVALTVAAINVCVRVFVQRSPHNRCSGAPRARGSTGAPEGGLLHLPAPASFLAVSGTEAGDTWMPGVVALTVAAMS